MSEHRAWIDDGSISAERARKALPILVRQARSEMPITYLALSAELGMNHHRPVARAAGYVGFTMQSLGQTRGWKRRPPPPLQALIVNKQSGVPGHGVDGFMGRACQQAQTGKQKRAALAGAYAEIFSYPHWEEILSLLEIDPAPAALDDLIDKAVQSRGRGGEGPEHKALKEYVATTPSVVGLRSNGLLGTVEYRLASGDSVDVVFDRAGAKTAVEVKSRISTEGDIARGLYQCVKYRAVLEAQASLSKNPFDVAVFLVLGGALPSALLPLVNGLGVAVIANVMPA